jgi:hypothetical protein
MNENEETTKQDELDEVTEELDEEIEDVDLDNEDADEKPDFDFDYDDEGNIVIPEAEDEGDDTDGDEEAEAKPEEVKKDEEKEGETTATENTDKGVDELERFKAQARETLEKMGVKIEGDDILGGLVKLAAEADDTTPEEYLAKKAKDEAEARQVRANDLSALHEIFPETREIDDITKLPHFDAFARARISGDDAVKAYRDTHFNEAVAAAVARSKHTSLNGTKDHLRTSVPKGAKDDSITMSKSELASFRETFSGMSDKEIAALYKKVKSK